MVYIKTYIFNHFYEQHLVLLTMVPRNSYRGDPGRDKGHVGHQILLGKHKVKGVALSRCRPTAADE